MVRVSISVGVIWKLSTWENHSISLTFCCMRTPKVKTSLRIWENSAIAIHSLESSMGGSRGRGAGVRSPPPLKNHKNIGVISSTGPDPWKITKLPKPAFNVGPSSARQRNVIERALHGQADHGSLIVFFLLSPLNKETATKNVIKVGSPLTKLSVLLEFEWKWKIPSNNPENRNCWTAVSCDDKTYWLFVLVRNIMCDNKNWHYHD